MSELNKYAVEVDTIAKETFPKYQEAERAYNDADSKYSRYKQPNSDAEYQIKAAKSKADFLKAETELQRAKETLKKSYDEVNAVRNNLVKHVNTIFGANPDDIDLKTMELIRSGILKAADYNKLIDDAQKKNNLTMAKVIAKHAESYAKELEVMDELTARQLRQKATAVQKLDGKNFIDAFDMLCDTYYRCTNNPMMIDHWENLTKRMIESF